MIIAEIAKSENCDICMGYLSRLNKFNYRYQTVEADAPEVKSVLDQWRVINLPAILISKVDGDNKTVLEVMHGQFSPRVIDAKVAAWEKKAN